MTTKILALPNSLPSSLVQTRTGDPVRSHGVWGRTYGGCVGPVIDPRQVAFWSRVCSSAVAPCGVWQVRAAI